MLPLVNVTVGLHRPPSSTWWKLMKSYDYKPRTLNCSLDLHVYGNIRMTIYTCSTNFQFNIRLGNAVIIFNQIAINMTGTPNLSKHCYMLQHLMHQNNQNNQKTLNHHWHFSSASILRSLANSANAQVLLLKHFLKKLGALGVSSWFQAPCRFPLMILQELKNDVPIIIWYHVIAFKNMLRNTMSNHFLHEKPASWSNKTLQLPPFHHASTGNQTHMLIFT